MIDIVAYSGIQVSAGAIIRNNIIIRANQDGKTLFPSLFTFLSLNSYCVKVSRCRVT